MTWSKIDDGAHSHRKVRKAWRADRGALGLHFLALSYAGDQMTDGHVDELFVEEKLPVPRERARIVQVLVDSKLWDACPDGGWWIHDYLDLNPSRADIEARRAADAARKRNGKAAES